jgi:transposase InsO family protein
VPKPTEAAVGSSRVPRRATRASSYIEIFHNQRRGHSSLDYVSPGEYERAAGLNETSAA